MTLMRRLILVLGLWLAFPASGTAQEASLVYNVGGKLDKSFNESAHHGIQVARQASGITVGEYEVVSESGRLETVRAAARNADLVIVVGFAFRDVLAQVAGENPGKRFAIIDAAVDLPNVMSVIFKEQEGAFLVGVMAAMASTSGTVGFIGGMDSPVIRRFQAGFEQGVIHAVPTVRVIAEMLDRTPKGFTDPMAGYLAAKRQIAAGADVLFAAAGTSGLGVYQAAQNAVVLAIGVDSDQTYLFPGTMLTSMVKDVGRSVERILTDGAKGRWSAGLRVIGLADGGMSAAIGRFNRGLVSPAMMQAVEKARRDIIDGRIRVDGEPKEVAVPYPSGN